MSLLKIDTDYEKINKNVVFLLIFSLSLFPSINIWERAQRPIEKSTSRERNQCEDLLCS